MNLRPRSVLRARPRTLSPHPGAAWFSALLGGVDGDTFARFMSDASTTADVARILRALLRVDFLAAMTRGERRAGRAHMSVLSPTA